MTERQKGYAWGWMLATLVVATTYVVDQFMPPATPLWRIALGMCVGGAVGYVYLRRSGIAP